MTTVGYGDSDLLPQTISEKAYLIFFMLFSTTGLAVCIERLRMLVMSRHIFNEDFKQELPQMMRQEAIKEHKSTVRRRQRRPPSRRSGLPPSAATDSSAPLAAADDR